MRLGSRPTLKVGGRQPARLGFVIIVRQVRLDPGGFGYWLLAAEKVWWERVHAWQLLAPSLL